MFLLEDYDREKISNFMAERDSDMKTATRTSSERERREQKERVLFLFFPWVLA